MSLSVSVHWWFHSILYPLFLSHVFVILFTNTFLSFHIPLLSCLCVHFFHKTLSSCICSITCLPVTCTLLCLPIGFTFLSPVCLCLHTFYNSWSHNSVYVYIPFTTLGLPVYVCVFLSQRLVFLFMCAFFSQCVVFLFMCGFLSQCVVFLFMRCFLSQCVVFLFMCVFLSQFSAILFMCHPICVLFFFFFFMIHFLSLCMHSLRNSVSCLCVYVPFTIYCLFVHTIFSV